MLYSSKQSLCFLHEKILILQINLYAKRFFQIALSLFKTLAENDRHQVLSHKYFKHHLGTPYFTGNNGRNKNNNNNNHFKKTHPFVHRSEQISWDRARAERLAARPWQAGEAPLCSSGSSGCSTLNRSQQTTSYY